MNIVHVLQFEEILPLPKQTEVHINFTFEFVRHIFLHWTLVNDSNPKWKSYGQIKREGGRDGQREEGGVEELHQ